MGTGYEYFQFIQNVSNGVLSQDAAYEERCNLLLNLTGYRQPLHGAFEYEDDIFILNCWSNAGENMKHLLPNYPNVVSRVLPCSGGKYECGPKDRIIPTIYTNFKRISRKDFERIVKNNAVRHTKSYCETKIGDIPCAGSILIYFINVHKYVQ